MVLTIVPGPSALLYYENTVLDSFVANKILVGEVERRGDRSLCQYRER